MTDEFYRVISKRVQKLIENLDTTKSQSSPQIKKPVADMTTVKGRKKEEKELKHKEIVQVSDAMFGDLTEGLTNMPKVLQNSLFGVNKLKFNLPVFVSPLAYVSNNASIGEGTIIMHKAIINTKAKIGKNCIINTGAIIEHNVIIEDNCHVSTGSIVNGGAVIKSNSFIGSGAVVKQNIKIGKASLVNARKFIDSNLKDNSKIL